MSKYISIFLLVIGAAACRQGVDKTKLLGTWEYERTEFSNSVLGRDTMYQASKHNLLKGVHFVFTEDNMTIDVPGASNSTPTTNKYTWSQDGDALIIRDMPGTEAATLEIKQLDNQVLKIKMGGSDITVLKRVK